MSEKVNRAFKGVWIPKEIWLNEKLTVMEKLFLVEIDSLDNENGCFASNNHFSDFFTLSKNRCSEIIKSLEEKKYIKIKYINRPGTKSVEKRIIKVIDKPKTYSENRQGYSENRQGYSENRQGYSENTEGSNTVSNTVSNTKREKESVSYNSDVFQVFTDRRVDMNNAQASIRISHLMSKVKDINYLHKAIDIAESKGVLKTPYILKVIENWLADGKDTCEKLDQAEQAIKKNSIKGSNYNLSEENLKLIAQREAQRMRDVSDGKLPF